MRPTSQHLCLLDRGSPQRDPSLVSLEGAHCEEFSGAGEGSVLSAAWPVASAPTSGCLLGPIWSFCHHHSHDPVLDRKSPALVSKEEMAREELISHLGVTIREPWFDAPTLQTCCLCEADSSSDCRKWHCQAPLGILRAEPRPTSGVRTVSGHGEAQVRTCVLFC